MTRVSGIDHIVLKVRDVEASLDFYRRYLGAEPEQEDLFLSRQRDFLSIRLGNCLFDLTPTEDPGAVGSRGVAHICLVMDGGDPEELRSKLDADGVLVDPEVSRGRLGARGEGPAFYVTDPDGYRLELKWYE